MCPAPFGTFPSTLKPGKITVPLFVPKDVVRTAVRWAHGKREFCQVTVLKADPKTPNAKAELEIVVY